MALRSKIVVDFDNKGVIAVPKELRRLVVSEGRNVAPPRVVST